MKIKIEELVWFDPYGKPADLIKWFRSPTDLKDTFKVAVKLAGSKSCDMVITSDTVSYEISEQQSFLAGYPDEVVRQVFIAKPNGKVFSGCVVGREL